MAAAGFFFRCHSRRSLIAIHSYKCYELTTAAILAELVTEIYAFCDHQLFPCCRIAAMASAASSARARASVDACSMRPMRARTWPFRSCRPPSRPNEPDHGRSVFNRGIRHAVSCLSCKIYT